MQVVAIHRYPVKSMLGEQVPRAVLTDRGLAGDRAYGVLDVETGSIASAKVPRRWAAMLAFSAAYVEEPQAGAPVPPVAITFPDGTVRRSDEPGVDAALSEVFGREVRLVSSAPEGSYFEELWPDTDGLDPAALAPEKVVAATTTRREETGEAISRFDVSAFGALGTFFDLSSLHVITEDTLDHLRSLSPDATFDTRRYRPNLVLRGDGSGFAENDWPGSTVGFGEAARITYSFATMRCVMTTLAQGDLDRDPTTLRTIAKHNRIEVPQVGGVWACAGVYADVAASGPIEVGDESVPA